MIVPTNRLILWFALVVPPFATLAGVAPALGWISGAVIGGAVVFFAADALFSFERLEDITLDVPQVIRLVKDRQERIGFRVHNATGRSRRLRIGLALPREVRCPDEDMTVFLEQGAAYSSLSWPCVGRKHGRYRLERCYLETPSPLGFWAARNTVSCGSEIRVYPNLAHDQRMVASRIHDPSLGSHAQRQIGKGRDFEHLREYSPGDSYEDIHWKATARRGIPVTKIYQIERMQEIYLVIDASRLSARRIQSPGVEPDAVEVPGGPAVSTVLDRYITASLMMGRAAEKNGDLFGVLTFSDRVLSFVRAKNGRAHYNACRDAIYTLEARHVAPDFAELFTFIMTRIRRRALLVFLTGLDDPVLSKSFTGTIGLAARRHLILANMLRPEAARPLFSRERDVETLDDIYRHLGGHMLWAGLWETKKTLERRGVGFALVDNEKMCTELVSQYLRVKRRQVL